MNNLAIYLLKKYFNIKFEIGKEKNGKVWCRYITIQSKEEEDTYDTTAQADLTKEPKEFYILKNIIEKEN